jgi:hypothetical protein
MRIRRLGEKFNMPNRVMAHVLRGLVLLGKFGMSARWIGVAGRKGLEKVWGVNKVVIRYCAR